MANHLLSVAETTSSVSRTRLGRDKKDGTGDGIISLTKYYHRYQTVRACQQTTEQNNDANGGGQSPNSSNTGRWDSVSKAQYVKTKQIFLMKSNISCQKASKLLTIICISLIVCTSIIVTCRETTNHKKSFHRLKLQLSSQGKFTFGN